MRRPVGGEQCAELRLPRIDPQVLVDPEQPFFRRGAGCDALGRAGDQPVDIERHHPMSLRQDEREHQQDAHR